MNEPADEKEFLVSDLPKSLAIFPLPGAVLLPGGQLPLNIFEPRYLDMVRDAMAGSKMIGMIQPSDITAGMEHPPVYKVGCAGAVTSFKETKDGRFLITLTGIARFAIVEELQTTTRYRQVVPDWFRFESDLDVAEGAAIDQTRLIASMRRYLDLQGIKVDWSAVRGASPIALVTFLTMACPFSPLEKQALLEADDLDRRAELVIGLMEMAVKGGGEGGEDAGGNRFH